MPLTPVLRVLVVLPVDSGMSTLAAAQLCKETSRKITTAFCLSQLARLGFNVVADCTDNPIDALNRIEVNKYNALVVPVALPEHQLKLVDLVDIIRDLDNPIAIYYYRDALAEASAADRQGKYLEENKSVLETLIKLHLWRTHRDVLVRLVQGEVSDPSVPSAPARAKRRLADCLLDAVLEAQRAKELKEGRVTRVTLDDAPDSEGVPDDALIESFASLLPSVAPSVADEAVAPPSVVERDDPTDSDVLKEATWFQGLFDENEPPRKKKNKTEPTWDASQELDLQLGDAEVDNLLRAEEEAGGGAAVQSAHRTSSWPQHLLTSL